MSKNSLLISNLKLFAGECRHMGRKDLGRVKKKEKEITYIVLEC